MINCNLFTRICMILVFLLTNSSALKQNSEIHTEYVMWTWKNTPFYGFRGIRYAEPPIGPLRFKAPEPYHSTWNVSDPWQIQTNKAASACPSPYTSDHNEDCLHLNVYTRNLDHRKPVIILIHPGGFYIGSGNAEHFGPEYLLEQPIVLVTFNYRLGFLGFASTGDSRAPGNAGLKDQSLALRWVRQNIAKFGGDSDRVTVVGVSAGAMSVVLHLVSPLSAGLFHRAVVMSGSLPPQLKLPRNQMDLIQRQALKLNCTSSDWFGCLMATNASILASNVYKMFEFVRDNPIFLWLPVVEVAGSAGAFLTVNDPLEAIGSGDFEKVPLIVGTTENELASSAFELLTSATGRKEWEENFQRWGPVCLLYERSSEQSNMISSHVWNYYFGSGCCTFEATNKVFSDAVIKFPIHRLATLAHRHTSTFYYKFNYRGNFTNFMGRGGRPAVNQFDLDINKAAISVIEHCDDLQYLFPSKYWGRIQPTDADSVMVEQQTRWLANFALNGSANLGKIEWPAFDEHQNYVVIGTNLTLNQRPLLSADLWDGLFPIRSFSHANVSAK